MADKKISALPAATTPLAGTEVLPVVQSGTTDQVSVANLTAGRTVGALKYEADYTATSPSLSNSNGTGLRLRASTGLYTVFGADPATVYAGWMQVSNGAGSSFPLAINPLGGNVGINNNNPTAPLDVTGNIKSTTGNFVVGTAGKGIDFSANANAPGMTSELLTWYEEGTWTGTLTAATPPTTPITKTGRYTRIGNQITVAIEFDNVDTSGASGAMEVTGLPFTATASGYGPVMKSGIGTQVIMAGIYGGLSKVIFSDAGTMSTTSIVAGAGVYLRFSATYYV